MPLKRGTFRDTFVTQCESLFQGSMPRDGTTLLGQTLLHIQQSKREVKNSYLLGLLNLNVRVGRCPETS